MNNEGELIKKEEESEVKNPALKGRVFSSELYSGPIPHPDFFKKFEEALPGLADRVMTMSEKQSAHRQKIETGVIWFDGLKSLLGLVFAFLIVVSGIGAGTYLVMHDKNAWGLITILTPIGSVAGIFVYQNRINKKEELEKEKES
jgi:uncharacterized membrane protein